MRSVIFTLAKKVFSAGIGFKTRVSAATVFAVAIFLLSLLLIFLSYFPNSTSNYEGEVPSIVVVNPPPTFLDFIDGPDRSAFIDVYSPAIYDFVWINRTLQEQSASTAIAFPLDFETQLADDAATAMPDVLTYINPDSVDGTGADSISTSVLQSYSEYLLTQKGFDITGDPCQFMVDGNILKVDNSESKTAVSISARMIMPLLLIIMLTYAAMTSGVNSISGEKEKGTFYGLMLAPITRRDLVLGHLLGVFGRTLLPAILFMPIVILVHYQVGLVAILTTIYVCILFAMMMTTITVMFSVVGRNILSAQTAFLPVFLMILVVCIMSMQQTGAGYSIYKMVPFFGHYHAITDSLLGSVQLINLLVISISSLLISVIFTMITIRLLRQEAFTVVYDSESKSSAAAERRVIKETRLALLIPENRIVFGYRPRRLRRVGRTLSYHFWIPLSILSFFQTISLIAPGLTFLGQDDSYQIILDAVNTLRIAPVEQAAASVSVMMSIFMSQPLFLVSMALSYCLMIGTYILIVKKIEKNDLSTLGFPTARSTPSYTFLKALVSYGRGFLLGLAMIFSVYFLLFAAGQIRPVGIRLQISDLGLFFAYVMMWIPQGAAEEVMMRGYMLPRISARFGVPAGVFLSSVLFSLLHFANTGFTFLAFMNLLLIAAFFALLSLMTQEIYTVCAAHTAWNFAQGNILGMSVSGGVGSVSILNTQYGASSINLWTGGAFGPEGGLSVTVISVLSIFILCLYWKFAKNRKISSAK